MSRQLQGGADTPPLPSQCKDIDPATYGLINDLKHRGLFESTLIIRGGELGRFIFRVQGLDARLTGFEASQVLRKLIT